MIASGKLENRATAKRLDAFFTLKDWHNMSRMTTEVSDDTFSSKLVHGTPIPFFVESPEFRNDVNRHFLEDFINNFNSAIETVETTLVNISELIYNIDELKRNTDNIMIA